jgi:hypothetical protein
VPRPPPNCLRFHDKIDRIAVIIGLAIEPFRDLSPKRFNVCDLIRSSNGVTVRVQASTEAR